MDNDSAHHANIALRMYQTGNYIHLIDKGNDYLDKPHLHFWLSALSYHVFGVTGFAYKFPSFVFTVLGTYSTYCLGKSLFHKEAGLLSALIVSTAFAYMLANNDVRMDAILTASIAFATWQLVDWLNTRRLVNVAGAAIALALGFSTKGHIAVFTPLVSVFFYMLYKRDWKSVYHKHVPVMILLFFLFISPVVYCYYIQYDLHPEKIIRGRSNVSGVEFILWKQSFERFEGDSFGSDAKNDYFFFLHSFLWAFAPWSILAFIAFVNRIKQFRTRSAEWLTTGTFATMMVLISVSGFKLPHYLNIIFPIAAVMVASHLLRVQNQERAQRHTAVIQMIVCFLLFIAAAIINLWAFPISNVAVVAGLIVFITAGWLLFGSSKSRFEKIVAGSAFTALLVFYLLNANFYPQLLQYQAGNELAPLVVKNIGAKNVYFQEGETSWSLNFYSNTLHQYFHDSLIDTRKKIWLATNNERFAELTEKYRFGKIYSHIDFEITRLEGKFINPETRTEASRRMLIAEVLGRK